MSDILKSDPRSTPEIVQAAITTANEDICWDNIWVLQARGGKEELGAAAALCESLDPNERIVGVNILGQLGIPDRTFPQACGDVLLKLIATESDSNVLASIGIAFGHLKESRGVLPLVNFKNHSNPGVRMSVVLGLTAQEDPVAIAALIELSADDDGDIRNWATFALGSQVDADTPELRQALFDRAILETGADDPSAEIRGEALLGLAIRRDRRVINPLIEELESEAVGMLAVEAAQAAADVRLVPALLALQEWWDLDVELLAAAIVSCESGRSS
jgi:HEAT repeat protein